MNKMTDDDVRLAESRAARAWPPFEQVDADGWWLRYGNGASRRANSALALTEAGDISVTERVDGVEAYYRGKGLPPRFQVASQGAPSGLVDELENRGYLTEGASRVQFVPLADFRPGGAEEAVQLDDQQGDGWRRVYGGGTADGELRCRLAAGMPGPRVFASIERDGQVIATGASAVIEGWALMNCMSTHADYRRQGLAHAVLSALASWSEEKGCDTLFLQVEQGNTGAQSLYGAAGFTDRYTYSYYTLETEVDSP